MEVLKDAESFQSDHFDAGQCGYLIARHLPLLQFYYSKSRSHASFETLTGPTIHMSYTSTI